jgi:signal transduction histidine kinase/CheY-like chemotaxis protein/predicted hydrocarbon binding protein
MLNTVRVPDKFAPLFEEAQKYVARYFAEQRSDPEHGSLEICGQRYVLVRAASMSVEFYDMVRRYYGAEEEAHSVAHGLLFDIAHAMGMADAKAFMQRMGVTDPLARLSAGPVHFAHAGWAFVDISPDSNPTPDDEFYLLYDHPYSFESDSWLGAGRKTDSPVCVMNAGYSSGWCEQSFSSPLAAVEILCRAKGDDVCRFIMAPPTRVEERIQRYIQNHAELAPNIARYEIQGFLTKRTDPQLVRENLALERSAQQRAHELSVINERLQRDIAERRVAEAALSASQELNERLIDALPGGVVHVLKDGSIVRANGEALRILGLGYDELSRRYISDFQPVTIFEDGSVAKVEDYPVVKAITTGQTQPALTLGVTKPNAEISWAVFRAVPTRDPATHEISGAIATFIDITERKRLEEKLMHTQKLESLGVLAGGIAHDFNNLLVTILGNASLAKNLLSSDPTVAPLLSEIELGARRAAELTRQMLDYSGQGKFKLQPLDLPEAAREMAGLLRAMIPPTVALHYQVQEGLRPIEADPAQIRQVIMNLITNAAESMVGRTGRIVISVEQVQVSALALEEYPNHAATPGKFLSLEVSDEGTGMDDETRRRMFDPFFTTKFKGRGLGMAAVLGIVRSHSGAIRTESQKGVGTRVRVLLPAREAERPELSRAKPTRGTVLVVDDDNGVQLVVRRALSSQGFGVIVASSGADALRLFEERQHEIDLILMDVTMPHMSGVEALRRIRAAGSDVPVVLSSGYSVEVITQDSPQFFGYLQKPYDVPQLLAVASDAIASRAARGM